MSPRRTLQDFFATRPIFTVAELDAHLAAQGPFNPATRRRLLTYHVRRGHLVVVRRGLYLSVPRGLSPETAAASADPYVVASRMAPDAIVAYHSALALHGLARSVQRRVTYLTDATAGTPTDVLDLAFQPVRQPAALRRAGEAHADVAVVDRRGMAVRVTSVERSLVDVVDRPALGGGWEEVLHAWDVVRAVDLPALVGYALRLGNVTTTMRTGFVLELLAPTLRDAAGLSAPAFEAQLARLAAYRPRAPRAFDGSVRALAARPASTPRAGAAHERPAVTGRLVTRWNLVVPETVLQRAWAEPAVG